MINSPNNNIESNVNVNKTLNHIVEQNLLSNAYIFCGPEGVGKKDAALNFISKIIQKNNSDESSYQKIAENNHPDFLLIEPTYLEKGNFIVKSQLKVDKNQTTKPVIRINQIRSIRNFLGKKSILSNKKFVLIDDAHLLNEAASNCLLKTLEEPANGLFILISSELNSLLETIISRCQKIKFKPFTSDQLTKFLQHSTNVMEEGKINRYIEALLYLSNGSPAKLIDSINALKAMPEEIKEAIKEPTTNYSSALNLAKNISSELDIFKQKFLVEFLQYTWWKQSSNKVFLNSLEELKSNLSNNLQNRLSWEVSLLKIVLNKD